MTQLILRKTKQTTLKLLQLLTLLLTLTVGVASQAQVTYIHTDGLGSPVAKSNASGTLIAGSRTRYEPYGMSVAGTATPTIGFTGHVNDADTGLTYMQQRYYDPVAGRFLSTDPVLTDYNSGASFNRYTYALNNPYKYIDPDGRDPAVDAVLDKKKQTLTVTDTDTKKSITVKAFTGGHVDKDGNLVSPGTGKEVPAPNGKYTIVDNPNPKPAHKGWFGLFKKDSRTDDYFNDKGAERSGVRLHIGGLSFGCVTVDKTQSGAQEKWGQIQDMLNTTSKGSTEFRTGPHWYNGTSTTTTYGTLTIQ